MGTSFPASTVISGPWGAVSGAFGAVMDISLLPLHPMKGKTTSAVKANTFGIEHPANNSLLFIILSPMRRKKKTTVKDAPLAKLAVHDGITVLIHSCFLD